MLKEEEEKDEFEVDPIFKRFAYDYESNKYLQMNERLYPKDKRRIRVIEKVKKTIELEKERDENGEPITNINVELSRRNRITNRRPLEPLVFKEKKKQKEDSMYENEPLVKSSDAKRTNDRKIAEKQMIQKQKEMYANRIGYIPDYERIPLSKPKKLQESPEVPSHTQEESRLKQTLLMPEVAETNGQMNWELEGKLTEEETQRLKGLKKRIIVYINNNLRMHDNYLLCKAIQVGEEFPEQGFEVIPLYSFNPKFFMPRTSQEKDLDSDETRMRTILRTKFILESVVELKEKLKKVNSDLLISMDEPHVACQKLLREDRDNFIVFEHEVAPMESEAEKKVGDMARKNKTKIGRVWGCTAIHIEDLPYSLDKFPHLFGKFKKDIANISVRSLLNEPEVDEMPFPPKEELFLPGMMGFVKSNNNVDFIPTLEDFKFTEEEFASLERYNEREGVDYYPLVGGEDAANKRLNEYLWEKNIVSRHLYSAVSFHFNGDSSPKITPWTSIGGISPRKIFLEIIEYEALHKKAESKNKDPNSPEPAEGFKREMLWKDYFVFWALKHHKVYFKAEYGIYGREHYDWQTNPEIIKRVKSGMSGMPIVDAIVRDFNECGHMSYKAKMIFGNYFSGDLRQDWRKGGEYFEARMIDYEPCEIVGKWHQGAGIGPGRIVKYNCLTQSKDHDPKGEYIRRWVHELRHVPDEYIHDPWRMPIYLQKETSCVLGVDYPKPISGIRYTDASKGGPSDRTKAKQKPKKGKPLTEANQTSMLTFIQVTKEMRQAEEMTGKENEVA